MSGIAIIGMAGRFPGADTVDQFWENLKNGVESIERFAPEDLEVRDPESTAAQPGYVSARSVLAGADLFDASFFGCYPQEAVLMDPQHRVFLECCWHALEDAGYGGPSEEAVTGVFAGASPNSYFLRQLCGSPNFIDDYTSAYQVGFYPTLLGTIGDTLATRVAYKLNLKGPGMTVLTACSTSLVSVCQAAKSLQMYECDMALAGGVSITFPQKRGYLYQPGGMVSPDGRCRSFDEKAAGTVFGAGVGVVLLKRLEDALADRDRIVAVIRGSAVNNDGALKAGFTAPSIEGQARVISSAHAAAQVEADSISYIEAHGTGTPLGDPIEVAALTQAFRETTDRKGFCAIGTAKPNVGHLDVAAGVTGLIKAAQSLYHRQLPPLLHFERANPKLELEQSPFYVNTKLSEWETADGVPRRAGVSAFGVGGTNAHVVLEEGPPPELRRANRDWQILPLSAKSSEALDSATRRLAGHFSNRSVNLASAAYTLQVGRTHFQHRRVAICRDAADVSRRFGGVDPKRTFRGQSRDDAPVYFLFPGQGSQYAGMARELYGAEAFFRAQVDACAEILQHGFGFDLRQIMFDGSDEQLRSTVFAQPALFTIEYSLARLWMHWGIAPAGMVGHSVGEFTAACLSGVMSLEDSLLLVATRGRLMASLPEGAMLAVRLPEAEIAPLLTGGLSIAALNSPSLTVVAGPVKEIAELESLLAGRTVACRRLNTSHAFHSPMVDSIVEPLLDLLGGVRLAIPKIPYVSTATGSWISGDEACSPAYWARHCRDTVQFSKAISILRQIPGAILLEVGPGTALQTLARQHSAAKALDQTLVSSLPDASSDWTDSECLLTALGRLWVAGAKPDWKRFQEDELPHRVSLPGYPFERRRYWAEKEPRNGDTMTTTNPSALRPKAEDKTRRAIAARVARLLEDLSGMPAKDLDHSTTFLELGFDSLFLTQVSQAVSQEFRVTVTFRQLLDDLSNIDALTDRLCESAPELEAPVAVVEPASGSDLQRLMRDQMEAMTKLFEKQLAAVNGAPAAPLMPVAVPEFAAHGPYKPVQAGPAGGLTDLQAASIAALIERYTSKTHGSKKITQKYRKVLADPRVASGFRALWKEMVYPITTKRSAGSKLWDVDGNEYIDLLNGFGPTALGHLPDFIRKALEAQLREGIEIGPQTELAGTVAQKICDLTGNERVTFCNTGSEAVMAAIRVARTVSGRNKIVMFSGSYHGTFDEVLVKRLGQPEGLRSGPIAPGIPVTNLQNVIVLDYGDPASLDIVRKNSAEIAAVLVEPVQSRHPALQPREFLRELRRITEESGSALILDEIVTGFRTHPGGVQALFEIRADLVTYGKVLGGGMPIGALAGKTKYMDALDGGMWEYGDDSYPEVGVTFFAGTFVRHPLALAAANAVLDHLKEHGEALQERLTESTLKLTARLNALFEKSGFPPRVESFGSVFFFSVPRELRFASLLYYYLREKGIHIQEGFPCFVGTAHTAADLDRVYTAFEESLAEMRAADFLAASGIEPAVNEAPLTEPQLEIWLAARLGGEASCSFNEAFTIRLGGHVNVRVLRDCLQTVVDRHDALRSSFDDEGKVSRFAAQLKLDIAEIDLSAADSPAAEMDRLVAEDARTPFDLSKGPLLRVRLLRMSAEELAVFVTSHHIVCDGWSTNVILEELAALYSAAIANRKPELPPVLPFSDFARGARRDESRQGADETYWLEQFADLPPVLELPLDRARPAVKTFAGATLRRRLDPALAPRLRKVGGRQGATLFSTLLAAFNTLLFRLTRQKDLVTGVPSAAQSLVEGKNLVGHGVNFLPLRTRIEDNATFDDLLRATKKSMLDAYEHQQFTYGTLVRKLGIKKDPSRLPLVEVQFNLERVGSGIDFGDLRFEVDSCPKAYVNFDLFFNVIETNGGLIVDCDYNSDLYDAATIERWLGHYETLLRSVTENSACPLAGIPILTAAERDALISGRNRTTVDYPRERLTHDRISSRAAETPQAIAVVFGQQLLTYAELNERSSRLAIALRKQGAGPNQLVAIHLERSLDLPVAMLAVLKSGAAYVPLDPAYPKERIDFILAETKAKVLLSHEHLAVQLNTPDTVVICLDREWPLIGAGSAAVEHGQQYAAAGPDDLAYVIYTSGSTGKPKGVQITHRSLTNFLCAMAVEPGIDARDRLLAVTTLSFDIAGLEIFLPLVSGARVTIAGSETTADGGLLAALIEHGGITMLQATPATWRILLEAGWKSPAGFKMLCGGEALPRDLADSLGQGGGELWNLYGPTETTIWSAVSRVEAGTGPVRIGHPIANTTFYVLDEYLVPAPPGVPGELYIGGDGVARGYLERDELTKSSFLPDQFRGASGATDRMFRTGDLVRTLPDGMLDFLGRTDHQVKIRGFRIELGEIETVLGSHPSVRDCVVAAQDDGGVKRLVAYLTAAGPSKLDIGVLKSFARESLPAYMAPSIFVTLDTLPRTTNGKIDRKALPHASPARAAREMKAPSGEFQTKLSLVFREVLRLSAISADDNLFELGADSIQVFQIVARANRAGVPVSAQDVLRNPTVEALAKCAGTAQISPQEAPQTIRAVSRDKYRITER